MCLAADVWYESRKGAVSYTCLVYLCTCLWTCPMAIIVTTGVTMIVVEDC